VGGFPFRETTTRTLALAAGEPCGCSGVRGLAGCLPCQAQLVRAALACVHLPALTPPPLRARPPLLEHVAAEVVGRRQACTECGALLEAGGRGTHFWPAGTRLFALPGQLAIGPEIAWRPLQRRSVTCTDLALSSSVVTPIGFGPMKFVALLRVSTAGQARDGYGLEAQEQDIRTWARLNKHRIAYVVRESVPGDTALNKRPALAESMQVLLAGKADGVVVARLDRLARDLILQEQLIREVDTLGGVLRSAAPAEDAHLLDNDPQRVLIRQILGAIAQYDRAMIRLRLGNGLRMKEAAGGYIGGAPPYGWTARGGQLVPLPAEQQTRQRIKEWRRQGWSYRKIADRLNDEGIPTKKGGPWYANTTRRVVENVTRAIPTGPLTDRKAG
jgi:DNA invertase Pin-like site-specific DNA recombinase